ncbi:hypothetical protein B0T25DRAFT_276340 [Lasiosphaeria hispida]|uniref:Short chain dehydrogenase/reductase n=1 Tax=Lasiosphaeria hispida TaxID=260671 RepID=A0AAJ0HB16_9PEZI|nr:hypothetical protein B0T25DRAFT_276340 [Lasiosphaeria hispida]
MPAPANGETAPKSVIVTGGASGIGLAMSRYFASLGSQVAILDVNTDSGAKVAAELATEYPQATVSFKQCDVTLWDEQAAVFQEVYHGHSDRIDVVMANAGVSEQGVTTIVDLGEDTPSPPKLKSLNINLIGTIYSVKLAVHYMNKKPQDGGLSSRGSIICTASNAGLYPFPLAPLYATSKFGVVGLVRSTARAIEESRIQINALAPAVLETNIGGPDEGFISKMIVTPMSTLIRGVADLIADPSLTGQVAEIHGNSVTIRPQHEFVDEDTEKNIEMFWNFAKA